MPVGTAGTSRLPALFCRARSAPGRDATLWASRSRSANRIHGSGHRRAVLAPPRRWPAGPGVPSRSTARGPGRPGYVTIPCSMGWVRSITLRPLTTSPVVSSAGPAAVPRTLASASSRDRGAGSPGSGSVSSTGHSWHRADSADSSRTRLAPPPAARIRRRGARRAPPAGSRPDRSRLSSTYRRAR